MDINGKSIDHPRKVRYMAENDRRYWALLIAEAPDGRADLVVYRDNSEGEETADYYQDVPKGTREAVGRLPNTWHEIPNAIRQTEQQNKRQAEQRAKSDAALVDAAKAAAARAAALADGAPDYDES